MADNLIPSPGDLDLGAAIPANPGVEALRKLRAQLGGQQGKVNPGAAEGSADAALELKELNVLIKGIKEKVGNLEIAAKTPGVSDTVVKGLQSELWEQHELLVGLKNYQLGQLNGATGKDDQAKYLKQMKVISDNLENAKFVGLIGEIGKLRAQHAELQRQEAALQNNIWTLNNNIGKNAPSPAPVPGPTAKINAQTIPYMAPGSGRDLNGAMVIPAPRGSIGPVAPNPAVPVPDPTLLNTKMPFGFNTPIGQLFAGRPNLAGVVGAVNPGSLANNASLLHGAVAAAFTQAAANQTPVGGPTGTWGNGFNQSGPVWGTNTGNLGNVSNPGFAAATAAKAAAANQGAAAQNFGAGFGNFSKGNFGGTNFNNQNNPWNPNAPYGPHPAPPGTPGIPSAAPANPGAPYGPMPPPPYGPNPPPAPNPGGPPIPPPPPTPPTPPPPPPPGPGPNPGPNPGPGRRRPNPSPIPPNVSATFAIFMQEAKDATAMFSEFRAKQKYGVPSPLTRTDIKSESKVLRQALVDLMQDTSATQDEKSTGIEKFTNSMNKFEQAYREQSETSRKVASFVTGAFSTLQVGQLASKMMISDPLQYGTMPALSAMGNTGKMGGALASAMGANEQWKAQQNQAGMTMGLDIAGMSMLLPGVGKLIGGAVGLGVAGVSAMGGGAAGRNILSKLTHTIGSDEITQNDLAKTYADPQTLIQRQQLSQNMYVAMGGKGIPTGANMTTMGNYINGGAKQSQTGNYYLDQLDKSSYGGTRLRDLGLDPDERGKLLAQTGGNLVGANNKQVSNLATFAGVTGAAHGVDPSQIIQQFQGLQSGGIEAGDLKKDYNQSLSVYANERGEVSQFAANVLQPALAKVAQSASLKNVSISADKMTEQVNAFQKILMTGEMGNTGLGKRAAMDASVGADLTAGASATIQDLAQTPAGLFALRNSFGLTAREALSVSDSPDIQAKAQDNWARNKGFSAKDIYKDDKGTWHMQNAQLVNDNTLKGVFGGGDFNKADINMAMTIKRMLDGTSNTSVLAKAEGNLAKGGNAVAGGTAAAVAGITGDKTTDILRNVARQTELFTQTVLGITESISKLEAKTLKYTESSEFGDNVAAGMKALLDNINRLLGITGEAAPGNQTPTPAPQPTSQTTPLAPARTETSSNPAFQFGNRFNLPDYQMKHILDAKDAPLARQTLKKYYNGADALGDPAGLKKIIGDPSKINNDNALTILKNLYNQTHGSKPIPSAPAGGKVPTPGAPGTKALPVPPNNTGATGIKSLPDQMSGLKPNDWDYINNTILNPKGLSHPLTDATLDQASVQDEDAILSRIITKTQARLATTKDPNEKAGLQSGMSTLNGLMKTGNTSNLGSIITAAALNKGALDTHRVTTGNNGRAYSWDSKDMGSGSNWDKAPDGTPKKAPKVMPSAKTVKKPGKGQGTTADIGTNGGTMTITLTGDAAHETGNAAMKRVFYGGNPVQDRRVT